MARKQRAITPMLDDPDYAKNFDLDLVVVSDPPDTGLEELDPRWLDVPNYGVDTSPIASEPIKVRKTRLP